MTSTEIENQSTLEEEPQSVEEVQPEENAIDEENVDKNASSMSVLSSFDTRLSTMPQEEDLPSMDQTYQQSSSAKFVLSKRLVQLARPKTAHLEDTLAKYGQQKNQTKIEQLKRLIREHQESEKHVCDVPTDEPAAKKSPNMQKLYDNLQHKLRKVAFEAMASKIFDQLPAFIVQQKRSMRPTPETKALFDTLQNTLNSYLGQPNDELEKRVFEHLCYGLTKFVEDMIENVRKEEQNLNQDEEEDQPTATPCVYSHAVELGRKAFKERQ